MQLEPIPRRSFLKLSMAAGALAVTTLNGCTQWLGVTSEPLQTSYGRLLVLNETQAKVMHAFAEAVLPQGDAFPSVVEAEVIQRLDEELYFVAANISADVKTVIDVLEWLPVFYGSFSRFSTLDSAKRIDFLNRSKETNSDIVRAVINNCRMLCFNMYYGHESSWAAIGYDGPFSQVEPRLSEQRQHYARRIGAVEEKS